ncbi:MAG: hypothetical protein CM1200mP20_11450 [Pseudomonadota bacterium]|nr:MAG: hypothetical protein CM1200mP20_11450 [Pseudomonadota bacterium]
MEGLESSSANWVAGERCEHYQITARELASPSPLAQEIITARPYAFLDDAPGEERRTQAIRNRHLSNGGSRKNSRSGPPGDWAGCAEAWPDVRTADELHDALVLAGFISREEAGVGNDTWSSFLQVLEGERRAARLSPTGR